MQLGPNWLMLVLYEAVMLLLLKRLSLDSTVLDNFHPVSSLP